MSGIRKLCVRLLEIAVSLVLLEVCSFFALHQLERIREGMVVDLFIESHFAADMEAYRREFVAKRYDPLLGWHNKPNTRHAQVNIAGRPWISHIDADGARADGHPHAVVGVATYGDSMTFCSEVDDDQTWQYYLEERLGQDVKNFGVVSYGSAQALLKFQRDVAAGRVAPVTILVIFEENINRVVNAFRPFYGPKSGVRLGFKPSLRLEGDRVVLRENPFRHPDLSVESLKQVAYETSEWDYWSSRKARLAFPYALQLIKATYYLFDQKWSDLWEKREGLAVMEFIVREFADASRRADSRPVLLFIPTSETLESGGPARYAPFAQRMRGAIPDLLVIDVLEASFERARFNVLPFAGHASAYGNRVIADLLYAKLETRSAGR
ncbi:MAG: hypothetical protein JSU66_07270 [Deltaproteobacteria bacterium]|nr:MAG: hypothetical protein JSU66_07270 [Deltaproteobacteria bacterium]